MQTETGKIIAVWGPSGSPGKTTIALGLAGELADNGKGVTFVDLDLAASSTGVMLGLGDGPVGIAAAARLVGHSRFDADQFQRLSVEVPVGKCSFRLLAGLASAERWPEIAVDRAEEILAVAAENSDFVIVDLSSSLEANLRHSITGLERNAVTWQVLQNAQQVITICSADPVGIARYLREVSALQALRPQGQLLCVVNRLRTSVLGSSAKQQIAETLGRLAQITVDCFIPDDPIATDSAMKSAVSINQAKRSSLARMAISVLTKGLVLGERSPLDRRIAKLG
ncbi:MAG: hypothetical protein RIS82_70 [Actinomycetota bacterium]